MQPDPNGAHPHWTLAGLWDGARAAAPLFPGTAVFAAAFGTIAAQKGLTLVEATLMSMLVFAGASQLVAMEIWTQPLTNGVIVTLAAVTAVVNMRLLLMSASMRPWLGQLPAHRIYPVLTLTTDTSWLIGIRHRAAGGSDASVLLGSGLFLWVSWSATTFVGYQIGGLIAQPQRYGLDLILPIFFTAVFVPLWRGMRRAIPWGVAGVVALAVQYLVPGWWFMIAGALAGTIAGGFIDDEQ
jgi:predicted branched-subunit amino acid permease